MSRGLRSDPEGDAVLRGWALKPARPGRGRHRTRLYRVLRPSAPPAPTLWCAIIGWRFCRGVYSRRVRSLQGLAAVKEALNTRGTEWGMLSRSGTPSPPRGVAAATAEPGDTPGPHMFSPRAGGGASPGSEITGAARRHEPGTPVAAAGQACRGAAGCWHRSTAGSPRALTPPTSRRPRRCWRR